MKMDLFREEARTDEEGNGKRVLTEESLVIGKDKGSGKGEVLNRTELFTTEKIAIKTGNLERGL